MSDDENFGHAGKQRKGTKKNSRSDDLPLQSSSKHERKKRDKSNLVKREISVEDDIRLAALEAEKELADERENERQDFEDFLHATATKKSSSSRKKPAKSKRPGFAAIPIPEEPWTMYGGNEFALHPRSKFATLGVTPTKVKVKEVGFFSLYATKEGAVEIREDRSLMRSAIRDPKRLLPLDLKEEFIHAGDKITLNPLPILGLWAENNPKLEHLQKKIQIVTTGTLLTGLQKIAYGRDSREVVRWVFGAAKIKGKVFLGLVKRPGIVDCEQRVATAEVRETTDNYHWGAKFEEFMSKKTDLPENEGACGVIETTRKTAFRSVLHTKLDDLHLLLTTGIEADDPSRSGEDYPARYVDFHTTSEDAFERGQEDLLYGQRLRRWWIEDNLRGIGAIQIGLQDIEQPGIVTKFRSCRMEKIRDLVKKHLSADSHGYWEPDVYLGFLHALLHYVLSNVTKSYKKVVYEFVSENGETGADRVVFREIAAKDRLAAGHDYIPDNAEALF